MRNSYECVGIMKIEGLECEINDEFKFQQSLLHPQTLKINV